MTVLAAAGTANAQSTTMEAVQNSTRYFNIVNPKEMPKILAQIQANKEAGNKGQSMTWVAIFNSYPVNKRRRSKKHEQETIEILSRMEDMRSKDKLAMTVNEK